MSDLIPRETETCFLLTCDKNELFSCLLCSLIGCRERREEYEACVFESAVGLRNGHLSVNC